MKWQIDPSSPVALYEQVAASVRTAIAEGELQPGERLPAAKDVAAMLDVNMHTVLRAYQVLRDERQLDIRRGRGAVVIGTGHEHARLTTLMAQMREEARRLGIGSEELVQLVRKEARDG